MSICGTGLHFAQHSRIPRMRRTSGILAGVFLFFMMISPMWARSWLSGDASPVHEIANLQGVAISASIPDKSPVTVTAGFDSTKRPNVHSGAGMAAFLDATQVAASTMERFAGVVSLVGPGLPLPKISNSVILTEHSVRIARPMRVTASGNGHWKQNVSKPVVLPFRAERAVALSNSSFVVVGGCNASVGSLNERGNVIFGPATQFCRTMSVDNRVAALTANLVVVSFYDAPYYNLTTSAGVVVNLESPMNQRRLIWSRSVRYEADHMAHVVARLSPTSAALVYPGDTPFSSSSQSRWSQDEQAAAPLTARVVTVTVNKTSGRPVVRGLSTPATLRLSDVDGPFDCTGVSAYEPTADNSTVTERDSQAADAEDGGIPTRQAREHTGRRMRNGNVHERVKNARWSANSGSHSARPRGMFRSTQQVPSVICAFSDLTTGSLRTVLLQEQRPGSPHQRATAGSSLLAPHFTAMATVLEHAAVSAGSNSGWRDLSVARMSETGAAILFSDDAHGGRAVASLVGVSTLASRPSLVVSESRFDLTDRNPDPSKTLFWAGIATLGNNAVMLVDWASLETPQRGTVAGSIFGSQLSGLQNGHFASAHLGSKTGIHTRADGTTVSLGGRISVIMAGGVPAGVSTGGKVMPGEDVIVKVGGVAKVRLDTTAVGGCSGAHAHTAYAVPDGSVVVGSGNRLSALTHADHRWGVATAVTDPADGTSTSVLVATQSALGIILDCTDDDLASVLLRPGGGFH